MDQQPTSAAVDFAVRDGVVVPGTPRVWANVALGVPFALTPFDVHPDGKRVAMFPETAGVVPESGSVHVAVLLNFVDELRCRVPVGQ